MSSDWREDAPLYLAGGAAATSVVSIAASQLLLGLALVAVIAARDKWRWPPVIWPVLLWAGWTLVSLAASGHARGGFPQAKKLYVYLMLFVVYSALRTMKQIRLLTIAWVAGSTLSSLKGFWQFVHKYLTTPPPFYYAYQSSRITGFMGHWMTFSGLLTMTLMLIGAWLFFSRERRFRAAWIVAGLIIGAALVLAFTKSLWAGAAAGAVWLLWSKNKWFALPPLAVAGIILVANPFHILDRDQEHRGALRRVGSEMIRAHPITGVGPEQVGPQFKDYYPPDLPHPIPAEWYYQHLHNIYYHFAAERGLPALAALLWFLGRALFDFISSLRRLPGDSEARWVLHGAIAVTIAVMVSGWGEVNLGDSEVLEMFLAVIACGYVAIAASASDFQKAGR
jgi:O-antigen ligase